MRPVPAELARLRAEVKASYGWRTKGMPVSERTRAAMTDDERTRLRWTADHELVVALAEAEGKYTDTFAAPTHDGLGGAGGMLGQ